MRRLTLPERLRTGGLLCTQGNLSRPSTASPANEVPRVCRAYRTVRRRRAGGELLCHQAASSTRPQPAPPATILRCGPLLGTPDAEASLLLPRHSTAYGTGGGLEQRPTFCVAAAWYGIGRVSDTPHRPSRGLIEGEGTMAPL